MQLMKTILILAILSFAVFAQDKPKTEPKQLTAEEQAKLADLQKRAQEIQILQKLLEKDAENFSLKVQLDHDCKGCKLSDDGKTLVAPPPDKKN